MVVVASSLAVYPACRVSWKFRDVLIDLSRFHREPVEIDSCTIDSLGILELAGKLLQKCIPACWQILREGVELIQPGADVSGPSGYLRSFDEGEFQCYLLDW